MKHPFWVVILFSVIFSAELSAHGGGLDKYGCHRDNKKGNYHCHQGPDAGKTFPSKEAYEKQKKK